MPASARHSLSSGRSSGLNIDMIRRLISPSLLTSVLVTKAAYSLALSYPFQTSWGSRA
ncbi:Uncharacterised protein [Vibrio cholerae]|nr:Uncharacterised protein [Vibrio cholerae]